MPASDWLDASNWTTATDDTWERWTISAGTTSATTIALNNSIWVDWTGSASANNVVYDGCRYWWEPAPSAADPANYNPPADFPAMIDEIQRIDEMNRNLRNTMVAEMGVPDIRIGASPRKQPGKVLEKSEAEIKAEALLKSCLTDEQIQEYNDNRAVVLEIQKRFFKFRKGRQGNVTELESYNGKIISQYCVHVKEHVPDDDNVLAQILFAQTDLDGFLALANKLSV